MGRYSAAPTPGPTRASTTPTGAPSRRRPALIAGGIVLVAAIAGVGIASALDGGDATTAEPGSSVTEPETDQAASPVDTTEGESDGGQSDDGESPAAAPAQCTELEPLRVVAVEAVQPVLTGLAPAACVDLVLVTSTGTDGAAQLADGSADVWVPDSRHYALAAGTDRATAAPSVAWSPVVLVAASGTDAATLQALAAAGWAGLLQVGGPTGGGVELPEQSSAVQMALASTLSDIAAAGSGGDAYTGLAAAARTIQQATELDATTAEAPVAPGAVRVAEARTVTDATGAVVAVAGGLPVLEHPWLDGTGTPAAARLLAELDSATASELRAAAGLLDPNAQHTYVDGTTATPTPAGDGLAADFALGGSGNLDGNALMVLDTSGSMILPTADGSRLIDSVTSSIITMVATLNGTTSVGLWEFSYRIDGESHHRELAPIAPMATNLAVMAAAAASVNPDPQGGTALYSSVLDGVRAVRSSYVPDRTNLVLVFTDGKDEDAPGTLDLAGVTAAIAAENDPSRPVGLLLFAYGEADPEALGALVAANGGVGGVYLVNTPAQVLGAFTTAVAESLAFP